MRSPSRRLRAAELLLAAACWTLVSASARAGSADERDHASRPPGDAPQGREHPATHATEHRASPVDGSRAQEASSTGQDTTDGTAGVEGSAGVVVVATPPPPPQPSGRIHWSGTFCRPPHAADDVFQRLEIMGSGRAISQGTSISTRVLLDLWRLGVLASYDPISVELGDQGATTQHLVDTELTAAILSGPAGRLRVTGGALALLDASGGQWAPRAGVSATLQLAGAVMLDAQVGVSAYPFTDVDARAAVALEMVFFRLELGYRWTYLDEHGTSLSLPGPYFGGGLVW